VTGSTELGERLDPESLSQLMARWYGRMRAVLEAHGGTVQKFIGDAVRAVRAAEAMHGALEELNRELERDLGGGLSLRTGLQSGEVIAGNPALGDALVVGDAVNVAARLEQAAAPGQVLLGEATWRLARDAVTVAPRTELELLAWTWHNLVSRHRSPVNRQCTSQRESLRARTGRRTARPRGAR